ncbi:MAG: DUF4198 domain-containing protein [Burkholderiaceae bacterium]
MKQRRYVAAAAAMMWAVAGLPEAAAHTMWLEPTGAAGQYRVLFGGHQGKTEPYPVAKVGPVRAWDAGGRALRVDRRDLPDGQGVQVSAAGAVLLAASFDNGYWSKGADGKSRNVPMSQLPGAVSGVQALKYHKFIAGWSANVARPVGQPFEVTPVAESEPRAGEPMAVRVTIAGQPAAGIALAFGEEGRDAVTGPDGVATVTPRAGSNRLWAGQRVAVVGDPKTTERSIEYSLVFDAR